jgi:mannose-6-phosphate isomerase-like protein (cupin superfamily)
MRLFQTKHLTSQYDYLAPDESEIRLLLELGGGGLAHCTLPPSRISLAVFHKTVEEIWYFVSGQGTVWRKQGGREEMVDVHPGSSVSIPCHTQFQFRNTGQESLCFIIITMPPWPGDQEAVRIEGHWPSPNSSLKTP